MKIGAIYPQTELNGNPAALGAIGPAVEKLGYDYLLMYDHVAGAVRENREQALLGPYSDLDPFHDPLVAFAYLAGITRNIELADGFIFSGAFEKRILPGWQELQQYLGEEGRGLTSFGAEYLTPEGSSIEQVVELASRWRDAGGSHIGVRSMGRGFTDVRQHIDFFGEAGQRLAVG